MRGAKLDSIDLKILAVLQRRAALELAQRDVFVNVTGGLSVQEPGADLAVAAAVASSALGRSLPDRCVVLGEIGLPEGQRLTALLAFNVGVELGQLAVIALAAVLLGAWVKLGGHRRSLVRPASLLIAAVGLFWFLERVFKP